MFCRKRNIIIQQGNDVRKRKRLNFDLRVGRLAFVECNLAC